MNKVLPESGSSAFFFYRFCRECRDYALFEVEFLAEILRNTKILILAEILRKKLATGASG